MKNLAILVLLLTLSASCEKEFTKADINSDILISMDRTNAPFFLIAETEETFGCQNFQIATTVRENGNEFTVIFRHIRQWNTCFTVPDVARFEIALGELEQDEYQIDFRLHGDSYPATFLVEEDGTGVLTLESDEGVRLR